MGTPIEFHESNTNLWEKAVPYKMPSERVDGMDVLIVEAATKKAVDFIREGKGPYFLEILTYRYRPHSMFDAELYRTKAEVEEWKKRDPISAFMDVIKERAPFDDTDLQAIEKEVAAEIQHAVDFAEAGTWEPVEDLTRFLYTERRQP
jgi:pyruvate dehydrogenase E1 component alpha subunit